MILQFASRTTDSLEHIWEDYVMKRVAGTFLVAVYLVTIVVIEINRQGWLPAPFNTLPTNHFYAVEIAFTVLLFTEVVSLVLGLTRSFSRSIGIQLEILSLILLRDTFKQFTYFSEPLVWEQVSYSLAPMVADAVGSLTLFVIIAFYYRLHRSRQITRDEGDQVQFIAFKKLTALGLLVVFAAIGLIDLVRLVSGQPTFPFFETFYTVLIFTDVLMVLLSLRYSIDFAVTFRNFGYSVVTVFIRLTLIAPTIIGVLMAVGTGLFALALTLAYNRSGLLMMKAATRETHRVAEP
ncbi:MAG: hypothetical protein MUE40_11725 [Anaerolineae bacterium]|jgi:hypothetical protein|nr:hypothetical protein [Anaerolineae bacterium]